MRADGISWMIPPVDLLRAALADAIGVALSHAMAFCIEKSPFCLTPDHRRQHLPESGERLRIPSGCRDCVLRRSCFGVTEDYLLRWGQRGLLPVDVLPETETVRLAPTEIAAFQPALPTTFVQVEIPRGVDANTVLKSERACEGIHIVGWRQAN